MTHNVPAREGLPDALVAEPQWICWRDQDRDGTPTKIPVDPATGDYASATDPETWTAFEDAVEYATTGEASGVGFVLTEDGPFVGVDFDDCREPTSGTTEQWATTIIERLDSYTEISLSGTGYHVLVRGTLPAGRNRHGEIELYETARFFTVAGDRVGGQQAIRERTAALATIHDEYVQPDDERRIPESDRGAEGTMSASSQEDLSTLSDDELLARARNAANGEKFQRLWRGDTSGYDSHSEADMALSCLLAFWTGGNRTRMDQLFRQSGLHREKWDEVHYADGSTYGEKTIERAIATTSEFYDPDAGDDDANSHDATGGVTAGETPDDADRSRTYLGEKTRLLSERVDELEAALEQKTVRIDTPEAEVERLTDELETRDRGTE